MHWPQASWLTLFVTQRRQALTACVFARSCLWDARLCAPHLLVQCAPLCTRPTSVFARLHTLFLSVAAAVFVCAPQVKDMLSARRGHGGPHDAGTYNSRSWETGFFISQGGSWDSAYGHFFLSWYSGLLLRHCDRLLTAAGSVLNKAGRPRVFRTRREVRGELSTPSRHALAVLVAVDGLPRYLGTRPAAAQLTRPAHSSGAGFEQVRRATRVRKQTRWARLAKHAQHACACCSRSTPACCGAIAAACSQQRGRC